MNLFQLPYSALGLKHHRYVHTKGLSCGLCEKQFACMAELSKHKDTVHDSTQKYHCEHCGAKFSRKRFLDKHVLTHVFSAQQNGCTMKASE